MKKAVVILFAFALAFAVSARAAETIAQNTITVNGATTNTATLNVRGTVDYVKLVCPTGATGTVTMVTSDGITLFSKSDCTGTANYPVRVPVYTTAGVAKSYVDGGSNTVPVLDRIGIADSVTVTVIQAIATTNTYTAKIVFQQ